MSFEIVNKEMDITEEVKKLSEQTNRIQAQLQTLLKHVTPDPNKEQNVALGEIIFKISSNSETTI